MTHWRRTSAFLALGCALLLSTAASPDQASARTATEAKLDSALKRAAKQTNTPSATAAIVRRGEVLWQGSTGQIRADRSRRARPDTLYSSASMTKTIAATLAMSLVQSGVLAIDAPIDKYLPFLPGASKITPRMLLSHTAALKDYDADEEIDEIGLDDFERDWKPEDLLRKITGLKFSPGTRFDYSNSGFIVLGIVLERASGKSIEQLFQEIIAQPLGLKNSSMRYGTLSQRRIAHPLYRSRSGRMVDLFGRSSKIPSLCWHERFTDGGLVTTAKELAQIGNALMLGKLLAPDILREMITPTLPRVKRLEKGTGLGVFSWTDGGQRWTGHSGDYLGYQGESWTNQKRGLTIVVMLADGRDPTFSEEIWDAIERAAKNF